MRYVQTHRTRWTAAEAATYVRQQAALRSTKWHRLCLGLCARAYGYAASGTPNADRDGYVEASDYWDSSAHRHVGDRRPPVGALTCWTRPGRAGHIAVVVHSGDHDVHIASNDINDVVAVVPLGYIEKSWGLTYRGWAEPDFPNGIGRNPEQRPRPRALADVWWQRLSLGVTDSDSVRVLQRRLNATVRARLEVTGSYDDATRTAVAKYQRSLGWTGVDADGLIFDPVRGDGGRVTTRMLFPETRFDIHWTDPGTRPVVSVDKRRVDAKRAGAPPRPAPRPRTTRRPRTLSASGARMIGEFEGFSGRLYNDPAGHCTIGYGHLVHRGPINGAEPQRFSRGITESQGRRLLREDARPAGEAVSSLVRVPLSQQQFDALCSFTYNLGAGNLRRSQLLKRLNAGEYDAVPEELSKWVNAGGRELPGLVRRRRAEGVLFRAGSYPWQTQPAAAR